MSNPLSIFVAWCAGQIMMASENEATKDIGRAVVGTSLFYTVTSFVDGQTNKRKDGLMGLQNREG